MMIFKEGMSIKDASILTKIPYPSAKAVYGIFKKEFRTAKKYKSSLSEGKSEIGVMQYQPLDNSLNYHNT
jgi:hypothetical protein